MESYFTKHERKKGGRMMFFRQLVCGLQLRKRIAHTKEKV